MDVLTILTFLSGFCWKICQITQKHSYILLNVTYITASNDFMCFRFVLISNNYSSPWAIWAHPKCTPQPFLLSSYQAFLKQPRQVSLSISMHHFIWQKNVDFMKPKELICRFLVESWCCLGVWGGEYIIMCIYLLVFHVCVCVFFLKMELGKGWKWKLLSVLDFGDNTLGFLVHMVKIISHFWVQTEAVTDLFFLARDFVD